MSGHKQCRCTVFCFFLLVAVLVGYPRQSYTQAQSQFLGSVPTGQATGTTLALSLKESFERALKYNLGGIESFQNTRSAHALRLRSMNALLPDIAVRVSNSIEQINLRALGIHFSVPGFSSPTVIGPFGVADVRAYFSQELFNWSNIKSWKSSLESERASQFTYRSDRNLVVFTTGGVYLLVISDLANIDSIRAQVATAQTLYQNSVDQNKQGVIASIDLLRARVQLQTEQQRLIAAENQLAVDKLTLARTVGLPTGQEFYLVDAIPYEPLAGLTREQALRQAHLARPDYLSSKAQVRGAELACQAAAAENYPSLTTAVNYGDIGSPNFGTSHGTFSFIAALNIPVFQGSRVRADKLQADSALEQRKAELADLEGKIDEEVHKAFLNLESSAELVKVARSNIDLAGQTLAQARDRFAAGVADNLEVVQAQESVATANQSYTASLYSFNLAKLSLALAVGVAEQSALQYLGVK